MTEPLTVAEEGGFEPPRALTLAVFKTAAFDRSATLPLAGSLGAKWYVGQVSVLVAARLRQKVRRVKPLNAPLKRAQAGARLTAKES